MPTRTPASPPRSGIDTLSEVAAAARVVWCCAGPLIVAGAGLAATGGALLNTWLITMGTMIALMGVGHALSCRSLRRRGLAGPDDCCATVNVPTERGPH
ncbi:MAG: hypothetical protein HOY76_04595 [Streptomyces sp.]|nr:hypothetical protein [Streptomyces sp.]NUQ98628.1 hypothetical protein [Streptomyces sp.]